MNEPSLTRRSALAALAAAASVVAVGATPARSGEARMSQSKPWFRISLAQWSLHRTLRAGGLDHLDFAAFTRRCFDLDAIEYVSTFFRSTDADYLRELNTRAADERVEQLLIMVDGEGALGDPDPASRAAAIDNHRKWLDAARTLGCHSIRVNAQSAGERTEQERLAADGLRRLTELAEPLALNVIVENHGGLSSDGSWLSAVMRRVDHPRCGTLPDFGNFCFDWARAAEPDQWYDRYLGVREMMPFAKAVSAKSSTFNAQGDETGTDYARMLGIVREARYRGWIGIEYEGQAHSEFEGIRLTKALLERLRGAE